MTSTIFMNADTIKGYRVWVATTDTLDYSYIYAQLYRKILECDDTVEIQKYQFSCGLNVPYGDIDTLIIVDKCLPLTGIPKRIRILSMTRLEARGHVSSSPFLINTDHQVIKLIEKILLNQSDFFCLTDDDKKLLAERESYRRDIRHTTDGNSE